MTKGILCHRSDGEATNKGDISGTAHCPVVGDVQGVVNLIVFFSHFSCKWNVSRGPGNGVGQSGMMVCKSEIQFYFFQEII